MVELDGRTCRLAPGEAALLASFYAADGRLLARVQSRRQGPLSEPPPTAVDPRAAAAGYGLLGALLAAPPPWAATVGAGCVLQLEWAQPPYPATLYVYRLEPEPGALPTLRLEGVYPAVRSPAGDGSSDRRITAAVKALCN